MRPGNPELHSQDGWATGTAPTAMQLLPWEEG